MDANVPRAGSISYCSSRSIMEEVGSDCTAIVLYRYHTTRRSPEAQSRKAPRGTPGATRIGTNPDGGYHHAVSDLENA